MPTGELFIHNLQHSDELQSFRCRSMHKLTRQVVISSPARLRVNGNFQSCLKKIQYFLFI